MMLAKLATPGLLEIKIFHSNNGYDVIVLGYDVTNKLLSHDSNCRYDHVTKVW